MAERLTNPQELPPYELLMERVLEKTRENVGQGQVEQLMATIAYHETGPHQRNYPDARQEGGPGRGLYQYELQSSAKYPKASGAGRTAMNRLLNLLGEEGLPKWARKYFDKYLQAEGDVDFSELTEEQQNILFLADKLQDPIAGNIAAIGTVSDSTWWQQYHYKGKEDKEKLFQESRRSYLNNGVFDK